MARLLLLASLAISASGCLTLGDQRKSPDKDHPTAISETGAAELSLRDGGPKNSDESRKGGDCLPERSMAADAKKSGERNSAEQKVRLRIMIAEVDRPEARTLGFVVSSAKGDDSRKLPWVLDDGALQVAMKPVLEKLGYAHVLAEDTMVVQNGQAAKCLLSGGFDPVKYAGVMLEGVSSIPFGVYVNLTPTITDGNRIRLEMNTHVSDRDTSTGAIICSVPISGIKTRHLKTTIEMSEGQAFAVAGLVENNFVKQPIQTSFLAGIPLLNRLVETDSQMIPRELVLLVTPELVRESKKKD